MDNTELEIRSFIKFMKEHGSENCKYDEGFLRSPGCNNDYGCCSKEIDLDSLAEELSELLGIEYPLKDSPEN